MSGKKTCCVWGCLNTHSTNPSLSFFTLPTDKIRRNHWLQLILRQDLVNKNYKSYVVCEIHFDEQFIVQHSKCKILSRKAIPSSNLPSPSLVLPQQQDKGIQVNFLCYTEVAKVASTQTDINKGVTRSTQTAPSLSASNLRKRKFKNERSKAKRI